LTRDGQKFDYKTVVEEPEVLEAILSYGKRFYRFDDAYRALVGRLASGKGIKGSVRTIDNVTYYMFAQKANKIAKTPRLSVIYRITDTQVILCKLYAD